MPGWSFDTAGNLYGTTEYGGAYRFMDGIVFKLVPNPDGTWTESVLHSFTGGADGAIPFAGLIFDAAGNLYGTTFYGGTHGNRWHRVQAGAQPGRDLDGERAPQLYGRGRSHRPLPG